MSDAYEQPRFVSKAETEAHVASKDRDRIVTALIGAALESDDRAWVEGLCLKVAGHEDKWVRKAVATSAAHLARIHGALGQALHGALTKLADDPEIGGDVEDALDDINTFVEAS
ncbi:MAG: hypothetical protein KC933_09695 [Myxococcales bacterium]|nr:hypothetical protein [Myxococcales bacterium]MCB9647142.1 hypothetical protein [Deltaproteobacteria bacterium]